jgi:hypothetical protein
VAADEFGRAFEVAAVEVQVAAAEGCGGDFEDCVRGFLDVGVGSVFDSDLEWVLDSRLHCRTSIDW